MKRKIFISLGITLGLIIIVTSIVFIYFVYTPMGYKMRMISDINKGYFEQASQKIIQVQNWDFDGDTIYSWIDVNQGLDFYEYLDSMNTNNSLSDSVAVYIAQECSHKGKEYRHRGKYAESELYFLQANEIYKAILGCQHLTYASSLQDLAILYYWMVDYTKAVSLLNEALDIRKTELGNIHPIIAETLTNLGSAYSHIGDYSKSEDCFLQVIEIQNAIYGEQHPSYAQALNNLGELYNKNGYLSKAERFYLQALSIYENEVPLPYAYTNLLENLGHLYCALGEYAKSESYYEDVLRIRKELVGEWHPDYAHVLEGLSVLYSDMGDYTKAEKYELQVCKINKKYWGENHFEYALSLGNLGALYASMDDTCRAEECLKNALEILNEHHPAYAFALLNLGKFYHDQKDYLTAESYYRQSDELFKNIVGEQSPYYVYLLSFEGRLFYDKGDLEQAEVYYGQAKVLCKTIYGDCHPIFAMILLDIGKLYEKKGELSKAEKFILHSTSIYKEFYIQSLNYQNNRQREQFWNSMRGIFEKTIPRIIYSYNSENKSSSIIAYDNELFKKGVLLNSTEIIKHSIFTSGDTALIHQWHELSDEKNIILTLQEKEPKSLVLAEHIERAEQLEKQITISSAAYRENQALWYITWDSVRNHLKKNQVAIEYFTAPLNEDSTMYCALLLRNNSKYPQLIPLFSEKEALPLINIMTAGRETPYKAYDYNGNGKMLTEKVWGKILPHIKQGETIYFAPSGLIHQLAIEALPYDSTHTMADMFNLVRLSSTREIVLSKGKVEHKKATLYGGIQYNMSDKEFVTESKRYADENIQVSRGIDTDTINRGTVSYLKGTKEEVENINQMLKDSHLQVQLYTSTTANEESFKALSGEHQNILHIATHGFYWSDSTAQKADFFSQRITTVLDRNIPTPPSIDPLNRCGLLFAGANTAYSGHSSELPEGVQDGILTAKEISLLDLRDADLVVLSACETGKGEITGEGVFGLQRAFKQAGAQTLIMSLWKVDDKATQLLMTEFYRNWITNHQSKREAFRNAQNAVRSQYKEPYYWAGFIMLD